MTAQKLAQLDESTNHWRYQRSPETLEQETRGILNQRKSALLKKQDVSHPYTSFNLKTEIESVNYKDYHI